MVLKRDGRWRTFEEINFGEHPRFPWRHFQSTKEGPSMDRFILSHVKFNKGPRTGAPPHRRLLRRRKNSRHDLRALSLRKFILQHVRSCNIRRVAGGSIGSGREFRLLCIGAAMGRLAGDGWFYCGGSGRTWSRKFRRNPNVGSFFLIATFFTKQHHSYQFHYFASNNSVGMDRIHRSSIIKFPIFQSTATLLDRSLLR